MISPCPRSTTRRSPRQAGTARVSARLGSSPALRPPALRRLWGCVGGWRGGRPAVLPAGSESWLEGAEMLGTGEADAADVQVSKGSCGPPQLHASPACPGALCGLWSSSLVPSCAAAGDAPHIPHVVHNPVKALTTLPGTLLMVSLSRAVSTEGPGLPRSSLVSPSAASGLSGLLPCRMPQSLTRALQASAGLGARCLQPVSLQAASPLPAALLGSLGASLAADLLLRGPSSSLGLVIHSFQGIAVSHQSVLGWCGLSCPYGGLSISLLSSDGRGLAPDLGASGP